jgi:phosphoglycerol transferase MdoB-like AlkP superfamily enzyme
MLTLGALILIFAFLPSALVVLWKETHSTKRLFMFISAFLTGTCFIAGTLFKIQHWPYAGSILTIGAMIGVLFFIPSLLLNRMNDLENKPKRPAYILGATGSMLFVAGLLFKIQHWPLATTLMVTGVILLVIIALPLYTWLTWKEERHIFSMFIFLIVGSLLIIMPGALLNLNLQHSYQEYYYPNNSRQNELFNYLFRNNSSIVSSYHDSLSYKQMEQLHSKTIAMLEVITNIQEKMVEQSEGDFGKQAVRGTQIKQSETGKEIIYTNISNPMDPGPSLNFLLPGCTAREELNSSMADYITYLTGLVPPEGLTNYKKMLDTDTFLPVLFPEGGNTSLMSGLHSFQIMKNGLLTVESSVLNAIAKHK